MDSSAAPQPEQLVAVQGRIRSKREGRYVLKANLQGSGKKPYEKPKLRVYGDIRAMTQSVTSARNMADGKKFLGMLLKTH
jgi:hypothetical protein